MVLDLVEYEAKTREAVKAFFSPHEPQTGTQSWPRRGHNEDSGCDASKTRFPCAEAVKKFAKNLCIIYTLHRGS